MNHAVVKQSLLKERKGKLTRDQIYKILTSTTSHRALARLFKVSHQTIMDVRFGQTYRYLFPDLSRKAPETTLRCWSCVHYKDGCTLDLAEYSELGPKCASECACYTQTKSKFGK